jgi:class 3 adenylate cyclase/tetratricopeptide (TPR) repeat protein
MQDSDSASVQTFLFADVRGYTRYTQEHGDEAAARLAERFAAIASEVLTSRGGHVVEVRGDEVLAAFASPRRALRAAVELQQRLELERESTTSLPLHAGIGLDCGEAVPVGGGFRGGALNLAARLCALAAQGEILASEGVIHLARKMDGIEYLPRGESQLKGFADSVQVIEVRPAFESSDEVGDDSSATSKLSPSRLPIGGFLGALPTNRLVGRQVELQRIDQALDDVAAASGRLVLLAGEPGVGKTRLAQEVTLHARNRSFTVASGRCYETYAAAPLYPFRECTSTLYSEAPAAIRALVPGRWPHLGRLVPELATAIPPAASSHEEQQRLFWAITGLVQAVAEISPVALLLDDLQWADGSSLELLQHLTRRTRGDRVLLFGTYRDVDVGRHHPLERTVLDLSRERLVERISVSRLDREATAALMATTIGDVNIPSDFGDLIYRRTDGNPFFTEELVRSLVESGDVYRLGNGWMRKELDEIEVPESVRSVIGQRLSRLSTEAQDLLREASILGQTFAFDDLQILCGQSEEAVEGLLEESLQAGLIRLLGRDRYSFNHALTQHTLYTEIPSRRRRRRHLAAGEALEGLSEPVRERRAAELAWHFAEGADAARGFQYAVVAGDQAEALWAHDDAAAYYQTALDLVEDLGDPRSEAIVREKLGGLYTATIQYPRALEMLERAAALYHSLSDWDNESRVIAQIGRVHFAGGSYKPITVRLEAAIETLRSHASPGAIAEVYSSLGRCLYGQDRYQDALIASGKAIDLGRQAARSGVVAESLVTRGSALARLEQPSVALSALEEAVAFAETVPDLFSACRGLQMASAVALSRGDLNASRAYIERARELAERMDNRRQLATTKFGLAVNAFIRGDRKEADVLASEAAEIMQRLGGFWLPFLDAARFSLLIAPGEWDAAPAALKECINISEAMGSGLAKRAQRLQVEEYLLTGRAKEALAMLRQMQKNDLPGKDSELASLVAWALADAGDLEEALRLVGEAIAVAEAGEFRPRLVVLLRIKALVASRQRRWDEAERAIIASIVLARSMPYPYAEARALEVRAFSESERGDPAAAAASAQEAHAIFRRLQAHLDAKRAEEFLFQLRHPRS